MEYINQLNLKGSIPLHNKNSYSSKNSSMSEDIDELENDISSSNLRYNSNENEPTSNFLRRSRRKIKLKKPISLSSSPSKPKTRNKKVKAIFDFPRSASFGII
jgi:hypothetical protein